MVDLILIVLVVGSIFRIVTYVHEQRQVAVLRKDIRFIALLLRVMASDGDWPPACREKFLEILKHENLAPYPKEEL